MLVLIGDKFDKNLGTNNDKVIRLFENLKENNCEIHKTKVCVSWVAGQHCSGSGSEVVGIVVARQTPPPQPLPTRIFGGSPEAT